MSDFGAKNPSKIRGRKLCNCTICCDESRKPPPHPNEWPKPFQSGSLNSKSHSVVENMDAVMTMMKTSPHFPLGNEHPDSLAESATLANIAPPQIPSSFELRIAQETIDSTKLSNPQLHAITLAAWRFQKHIYEGGPACGFFLGDGTGCGKGRIIAASILERWNRGYRRHVWVSSSADMYIDARRDLDDVGGAHIPIFSLKMVPVQGDIDDPSSRRIIAQRAGFCGETWKGEGVLYCSYSLMVSIMRQQGGSSKAKAKNKGRNSADDLIVDDENEDEENMKIENSNISSVKAKANSKSNTKLPLPTTEKCFVVDSDGDGGESDSDITSRAISLPAPISREDQISRWMLNRPGGLLVFDEAHKAKNLAPVDSNSSSSNNNVSSSGGSNKSTATGRVVSSLQVTLRESPVLYSSATGCTELKHMGYMLRLGLWGNPESPFHDFFAFVKKVERGGVSAMESVAMALKAQGQYIARTLSYDGVKFEINEVKMNNYFIDLWRRCSLVWLQIRQFCLLANDLIADSNSSSSSNLTSIFFSGAQRFYKQILVCSKVASTVRIAKEELARGNAVVISLWTTGESRTRDKVEELKSKGESLHDDGGVVQSAPHLIIEHVLRTIATKALESLSKREVQNEINKQQQSAQNTYPSSSSRQPPSFDFSGIPRVSPAPANSSAPINAPLTLSRVRSIYKRLLQAIHSLKLPPNPLDDLIARLGGPSMVAELSGRTQRFYQDEKTKTLQFTSRALQFASTSSTNLKINHDDVNLLEQLFFQTGIKRIAIITEAASAGISLHADRARMATSTVLPRVMLPIEVPWAADKTLQQLGRVHRSNQLYPPSYRLLVADVAGERRFVASVAQRLKLLGALTRGDRRVGIAAGSGRSDSIKSKVNSGTKHLKMEGSVSGTDQDVQAGMVSMREALICNQELLVRKAFNNPTNISESVSSLPQSKNTCSSAVHLSGELFGKLRIPLSSASALDRVFMTKLNAKPCPSLKKLCDLHLKVAENLATFLEENPVKPILTHDSEEIKEEKADSPSSSACVDSGSPVKSASVREVLKENPEIMIGAFARILVKNQDKSNKAKNVQLDESARDASVKSERTKILEEKEEITLDQEIDDNTNGKSEKEINKAAVSSLSSLSKKKIIPKGLRPICTLSKPLSEPLKVDLKATVAVFPIEPLLVDYDEPENQHSSSSSKVVKGTSTTVGKKANASSSAPLKSTTLNKKNIPPVKGQSSLTAFFSKPVEVSRAIQSVNVDDLLVGACSQTKKKVTVCSVEDKTKRNSIDEKDTDLEGFETDTSSSSSSSLGIKSRRSRGIPLKSLSRFGFEDYSKEQSKKTKINKEEEDEEEEESSNGETVAEVSNELSSSTSTSTSEEEEEEDVTELSSLSEEDETTISTSANLSTGISSSGTISSGSDSQKNEGKVTTASKITNCDKKEDEKNMQNPSNFTNNTLSDAVLKPITSASYAAVAAVVSKKKISAKDAKSNMMSALLELENTSGNEIEVSDDFVFDEADTAEERDQFTRFMQLLVPRVDVSLMDDIPSSITDSSGVVASAANDLIEFDMHTPVMLETLRTFLHLLKNARQLMYKFARSFATVDVPPQEGTAHATGGMRSICFDPEISFRRDITVPPSRDLLSRLYTSYTTRVSADAWQVPDLEQWRHSNGDVDVAWPRDLSTLSTFLASNSDGFVAVGEEGLTGCDVLDSQYCRTLRRLFSEDELIDKEGVDENLIMNTEETGASKVIAEERMVPWWMVKRELRTLLDNLDAFEIDLDGKKNSKGVQQMVQMDAFLNRLLMMNVAVQKSLFGLFLFVLDAVKAANPTDDAVEVLGGAHSNTLHSKNVTFQSAAAAIRSRKVRENKRDILFKEPTSTNNQNLPSSSAVSSGGLQTVYHRLEVDRGVSFLDACVLLSQRLALGFSAANGRNHITNSMSGFYRVPTLGRSTFSPALLIEKPTSNLLRNAGLGKREFFIIRPHTGWASKIVKEETVLREYEKLDDVDGDVIMRLVEEMNVRQGGGSAVDLSISDEEGEQHIKLDIDEEDDKPLSVKKETTNSFEAPEALSNFENDWTSLYTNTSTSCMHKHFNHQCPQNVENAKCTFGMRIHFVHLISGGILSLWGYLEDLIGSSSSASVKDDSVDDLSSLTQKQKFHVEDANSAFGNNEIQNSNNTIYNNTNQGNFSSDLLGRSNNNSANFRMRLVKAFLSDKNEILIGVRLNDKAAERLPLVRDFLHLKFRNFFSQDSLGVGNQQIPLHADVSAVGQKILADMCSIGQLSYVQDCVRTILAVVKESAIRLAVQRKQSTEGVGKTSSGGTLMILHSLSAMFASEMLSKRSSTDESASTESNANSITIPGFANCPQLQRMLPELSIRFDKSVSGLQKLEGFLLLISRNCLPALIKSPPVGDEDDESEQEDEEEVPVLIFSKASGMWCFPFNLDPLQHVEFTPELKNKIMSLHSNSQLPTSSNSMQSLIHAPPPLSMMGNFGAAAAGGGPLFPLPGGKVFENPFAGLNPEVLKKIQDGLQASAKKGNNNAFAGINPMMLNHLAASSFPLQSNNNNNNISSNREMTSSNQGMKSYNIPMNPAISNAINKVSAPLSNQVQSHSLSRQMVMPPSSTPSSIQPPSVSNSSGNIGLNRLPTFHGVPTPFFMASTKPNPHLDIIAKHQQMLNLAFAPKNNPSVHIANGSVDLTDDESAAVPPAKRSNTGANHQYSHGLSEVLKAPNQQESHKSLMSTAAAVAARLSSENRDQPNKKP